MTLTADNAHLALWYADASFAVHQDMKSHTGYKMTIGKGAVQASSMKQKINAKSSTEAELMAADSAVTPVLWTKWFLEEQDYQVNQTILYQDNKSTILLENNGKNSSSRRTRHINIRYFLSQIASNAKNSVLSFVQLMKCLQIFLLNCYEVKSFLK